ncbi:hypothetical protein A6E27_23020 [Bacillus cereus]|nr:hypothetical protein A6E27_23020 [Bacillus cereus]
MVTSGDRFERLIAIKKTKHKGKLVWKCKCDCGNTTYQVTYYLEHGRSKSCGCLSKERRARGFNTTHGLKHKNIRLYTIWKNMTSRCRNKNATGFSDYGGRGIRVCDSWSDYENFYNWAICNGYNDELTIDRVNNDGNYEPDNCKWATVQEQARNKRNTVRINGVSLRDIAEEKGFNPELAIERHYRGVTEEGLFIEGYLPRNQFKEAKH